MNPAQWLMPTIFATFLWALWCFLPKIFLSQCSMQTLIVFEAVGGLLVAAAYYLWAPSVDTATAKGALFGVILGVCGTGGGIFYFSAVSQGPVGKISVISALYPLWVVLAAAILLGEEFSARQMIGAVLGVCSLGLLLS